jgi:translation initiation factor IF-3
MCCKAREEIVINVGKESRNRVNGQIKAPEVRLINSKGEQVGVVTIEQARLAAGTVELDLVEIQPNAEPPVVRIMDYGKFLFQQSKQRAVAKKKQKQIKIKEVKFRPNTDKGDYDIKVRNLRGFLEEGNKARVTVWFKGREMTHQEFGVQLLERIKEDLLDCSKVEFFPKLEGRQLVMVLAPNKKV